MQAIRASEVIRDALREHFCRTLAGQEWGKALKDDYGRNRAMDAMLVSRTPSLALSHLKHPKGFVFYNVEMC